MFSVARKRAEKIPVVFAKLAPMHEGDWILDHPEFGELKVHPTGDSRYEIYVAGELKTTLRYRIIGRNFYPLKSGDEKRPAVKLVERHGTVVPVFLGDLSRVFFKPVDNAELDTRLHTVDLRSGFKDAAFSFVIGLAIFAALPLVKKVKAYLPLPNITSKKEIIQDLVFTHAPWLNPHNHESCENIYQAMIQYNFILIPLLMAALMLARTISEPKLSAFHRRRLATPA